MKYSKLLDKTDNKCKKQPGKQYCDFKDIAIEKFKAQMTTNG